MKLFPQDDNVVLYETGFEEADMLERKPISNQLSDLIERIETPIVLALDDKWGTGKTYFLKRWVAAHTKENEGTALTVYFDAFEQDYVSDPLISIITAVSERIPQEQQSTIEKCKSVATKLVKPTLRLALSLATLGAKQHLDEVGDAVAEAVSSEAKSAAEDLWDAEKERKDAIRSFKELLAKLTEDGGSPLAIVVDELDRCRPDYALSVLEVIKHFFAVPRVHFVLGVNGSALENSVQARYGGGIDAEAYLRKFINVSFSLPRSFGPRGEQAVVERYATHIATDLKLPHELAKRCINLISYVAAQDSISLRDVGKVFSKMALLPKEILDGNILSGWVDILCVLLVSSVVEPKLHQKLVSATATTDEIRGFLGASKRKTTETSEQGSNHEYDHNLAVWLVEILYTCGLDKALDDRDLPSFRKGVGSQFDRFGEPSQPKRIAAKIQRDWIDVFRMHDARSEV